MLRAKWKCAVVAAYLTTVVRAGLDIPPAFKEPPSDEVDAVDPYGKLLCQRLSMLTQLAVS